MDNMGMIMSHASRDKEYKEKSPLIFELTNKDNQEELKLVVFIIMLLCTVGSSIAFSMGGVDVLQLWLSPPALDCSLADLPKLQKEHDRFSCSDGRVDLALERTVLTTGGAFV